MPSINVDLDYFDSPEVKRLIGRLGKGSETLPLRLKCYCGKHHAQDGRFAGYAAPEIEQLAGWWGKTGEMLEAMRGLFLDQEADGTWYLLHWRQEQGHIHAHRLLSRKMTMARWKQAETGELDASSIPASNASSIPLSTASRNANAWHGMATLSPPSPSAEPPAVPAPPAQGPAEGESSAAPEESEAPPLAGFAAFWEAWPADSPRYRRKLDQGRCLQFWRRQNLEPEASRILAALARFRTSPEWTRDEGRWRPMPLKWLQGERWRSVAQPAAEQDAAPARAKPRPGDDPEAAYRLWQQKRAIEIWQGMSEAQRRQLVESALPGESAAFARQHALLKLAASEPPKGLEVALLAWAKANKADTEGEPHA